MSSVSRPMLDVNEYLTIAPHTTMDAAINIFDRSQNITLPANPEAAEGLRRSIEATWAYLDVNQHLKYLLSKDAPITRVFCAKCPMVFSLNEHNKCPECESSMIHFRLPEEGKTTETIDLSRL